MNSCFLIDHVEKKGTAVLITDKDNYMDVTNDQFYSRFSVLEQGKMCYMGTAQVILDVGLICVLRDKTLQTMNLCLIFTVPCEGQNLK